MKCQICGDDYYGEAGGKPLCKKHYDEAGIPQAEKRIIAKEEQIQREILQEGILCWIVKGNYRWGLEYGTSAGFKKEEVLELLKKHTGEIELFANRSRTEMMELINTLVPTKTKEIRRVKETDVKALAIVIIEEVKKLVKQRADALYLNYTYQAVEKIIRKFVSGGGKEK